jgi:ATP-dependent protease ClpP protease subunit
MLLAASAAQAADITLVRPEHDADPAIISVDGDINLRDNTQFEQLCTVNGLTDGHAAVVYFRSSGGHIHPAMGIGTYIHKNHLQTAVPDGADCASACALSWIAGSVRYLGQNSRVGFHSSSVVVNGERLRSADANKRVSDYLKWLNVFPPSVADYVTEAEPESEAGPEYITWLTPFNATKFKIYTRPLSELNAAPFGYFPFDSAQHHIDYSQYKEMGKKMRNWRPGEPMPKVLDLPPQPPLQRP